MGQMAPSDQRPCTDEENTLACTSFGLKTLPLLAEGDAQAAIDQRNRPMMAKFVMRVMRISSFLDFRKLKAPISEMNFINLPEIGITEEANRNRGERGSATPPGCCSIFCMYRGYRPSAGSGLNPRTNL